MPQNPQTYSLKNPVRVVTAASLFDGHDASINIMRRIMQASGSEVIHLGHNRSVDDIVTAAIDEDAQAVAASCYQGGHIEFFKYMRDLLNERGAEHIKIFGGGGGVIVPEEIKELEAYGVTKIYSPDHGRKMGLQGMVNHLLETIDSPPDEDIPDFSVDNLSPEKKLHVARMITLMEQDPAGEKSRLAALRNKLREKAGQATALVLGITGTGGSGKSSLTDELILRYLYDFPNKTVGILAVDPTRRKSGGALLGDRIRMNAINSPRVYLRSLATRQSRNELSDALREGILVLKAAGYDLVIVETAGIGQGDAAVAELVDISLYVMTSEFGAASQLEKIDMLDFADLVAINKFERKGSEDALRDVRKQYQRNQELWDRSPDSMPVYGTIAAKFNDDGVTALYHGILDTAKHKLGVEWETRIPRSGQKVSSSKSIIIPSERTRYLSEIAEDVRTYHRETEEQSGLARKAWALKEALKQVEDALAETGQSALELLKKEIAKAEQGLSPESVKLLEDWPGLVERYSAEEFAYLVRGKEIKVPLNTISLSGKRIPKVSLPKFSDPGEIIRWLREENVPGKFPFTAGVFPFKRADEDPTRMFAGEGDPIRTNRRFKYLSKNSEAKRLSTAFDSVTLYGQDPDTRPDIYGKVGNSGVSICTLDDVSVLYNGFDLCAPNTSVSMTINGPAPIMLAMFFNAAIDQQVAGFQKEKGREPTPEELENIKASVLQNIRGTVQADVLKEDQGQNTCIFSIEFALRMMGDIQQYFIDHNVRNYYSVSISGYHIAEAGANPITQLAFTLANGYTYVEYYLSRGMHIDSFAPNLSFFFSNGMDPEYTVIGRVARRIWAIAMKKKYGGSERSQMLKYHIQTSGRSLHSLEVNFNDIRTTLQALCAIYDNCNSLHTNAYDEAITTPSEESVRRALAIQLIINREWGLAKNENPYQGSFIVEELTELVEEAVLEQFDRLTERGGVLGAMETGYQRSKIQEESLVYEARKHTGELPIIGVNTFFSPHAVEGDEEFCLVELTRATEDEKQNQLRRLQEFQSTREKEASAALERLKETALSGGNIFEELMETTRVCSLGQITRALYEVGGQYRRAM